MKKVVAVGLFLGSSAALAQTAPTTAPVQQQAIGQKLIQEINENVQLRAQILQLQEQIDKLKDPPKENGNVEHK